MTTGIKTEGTSVTVPEVLFADVSKTFAGASMPVLQGISLTVERGEFVSIIGPSGCGKSTLLKLVAGLSPCSGGEISVNGMKPKDARELVSFVFQDATLLPWRTVERNVSLALDLEGRTRDEISATVQRLLELVGLEAVGKRYPRQLSGGMKMRVSIARALATRPRLLLMDEPFAALDEMTRDKMNEELLRLRAEQGWTVLFVTHSVAEAVFLSSRVIVLAPHPGRVAHEVVVDLPYPRTDATRESEAFDALVNRTSRLLREAHKL
jgi:NitT/TauT family transport system ATP-binding protein